MYFRKVKMVLTVVFRMTFRCLKEMYTRNYFLTDL